MQVKEKPNTGAPNSERPVGPLDQLYPNASVIAEIVALTRKNTDLPPSAALFGAYSQLTTALAQYGFTVSISAAAKVSPNLPIALLLSDDADPGYLIHGIVRGVLSTPHLCEVPNGITSASLFAHAKKKVTIIPAVGASSDSSDEAGGSSEERCLSLLSVINGEDWLQAIHAENGLSKLRRQLAGGFHGERFYQWTEKKGDQITAPVYLSALLACRQSPFFNELTRHFFSSMFVHQFLIVLAKDRPVDRMPLYANAGVAVAAKKWAKTWEGILAGPHHYRATAEAITEYTAWWQGRLVVSPGSELDLRRIGQAVWKYALADQVLIDSRGFIGPEATRIACAVADRHIADLATAATTLAWETPDDELARKVAAYITAHPKATRGKIMTSVRRASDPASLNRALSRIAEMHAGQWLGERAAELRAAARGTGESRLAKT